MTSARKFGGVKITMQRVTPDDDVCVGCGRSHQECADWWEAELKFNGHAADTGQKSAYADNVRKIRLARLGGRDPFCMDATLRAHGYTSDWTPAMPVGSFVPTPENLAVSTTILSRGKGNGTESNRTQRSANSGNSAARGSGRRGKSKSIRRKR